LEKLMMWRKSKTNTVTGKILEKYTCRVVGN
jgi:hypothetical protein